MLTCYRPTMEWNGRGDRTIAAENLESCARGGAEFCDRVGVREKIFRGAAAEGSTGPIPCHLSTALTLARERVVNAEGWHGAANRWVCSIISLGSTRPMEQHDG